MSCLDKIRFTQSMTGTVVLYYMQMWRFYKNKNNKYNIIIKNNLIKVQDFYLYWCIFTIWQYYFWLGNTRINDISSYVISHAVPL